MLQEVLAFEEEKVRSGIDAAALEVERAASRLALSREERAATTAAHSAQKSALQDAKALFRKDNLNLQDVRRTLDEAAAVQQREDSVTLTAAAKRLTLTQALQEHIPQLLVGSACTEQHIEAVVKTSEAVGIEESLVQAF